MKFDHFKRKMEFFLKKDKLSEAINLLESYTSESAVQKEVILQSGKFESLRRQIRGGVINHEWSTIERNRIRQALKEIVDQLEEEFRFEQPQKERVAKRKRNYLILFFSVVILLSLTAFLWQFLGSNKAVSPDVNKQYVVVMDSPLKDVVYDHEAWKTGQTNADEINEILDDIDGIEIMIEKTSLNWSREDYLHRLEPALIIIHYSCFYEKTNPWDSDRKFYSFLEYLSKLPTKWLIYSRAFHHKNTWKSRLISDFPELADKVELLEVDPSKNFSDVVIQRELKSIVKNQLEL